MDERPIDADNHYYEKLDAFTRHLDKAFKHRGVRPVQDGKRVELLIGGQVNRFVPNPTFDPIIVPGCLDPLFRGQIPEGVDPRTLMQVEPLRAEYQDRDARLAVMDEQGLGAALLFPTLGCGVEEALTDDVEATMATVSAFNRWLEEDWGFVVPGPDPRRADAVPGRPRRGRRRGRLAAGAGRAHRPRPSRPGPGPERRQPLAGRQGPRPGLGPAGRGLGARGLPPRRQRLHGAARRARGAARPPSASARATRWARSSSATGRSTTRSPRCWSTGCSSGTPTLRVASIENGSDWLHVLVKKLRKQANQTPWVFVEDPLETLRRHVWVTPYLEEDLQALAELIGVERILFGSDWPHGEGVAQPLDFEKELGGFDEAAKQRDPRTTTPPSSSGSLA